MFAKTSILEIVRIVKEESGYIVLFEIVNINRDIRCRWVSGGIERILHRTSRDVGCRGRKRKCPF